MTKKYFYIFVTIMFLFSTLTITGTLSKTANVPSSPYLQSVTMQNNAVELNWTAPLSNGGFSIQVYRIYRSTSLNSSGKQIGTTTNLFYRDTSISKSSDYYYYITAYNTDGESSRSNIISIAIVIDQNSGFVGNIITYLPYLVLLGLLVLVGFGLGLYLNREKEEQPGKNKAGKGNRYASMKKSLLQRPKSKKTTYQPNGLDSALEKIEEILQETQSD